MERARAMALMMPSRRHLATRRPMSHEPAYANTPISVRFELPAPTSDPSTRVPSMMLNEPDHISQLRDTLQRFVVKEMPRDKAAQWDKENHFPREVFSRLAELGVMGLTVPESYGGVGRDIVSTMVTIEELSKRSLAISVPYIMSACYAGMNLVECADAAQKAAMLPKVATGELLFAYAWTEPDIGADLAGVRTTAVRHGDSLIVNGAKR